MTCICNLASSFQILKGQLCTQNISVWVFLNLIVCSNWKTPCASSQLKWQFPQTGIFHLPNDIFLDLSLNTIPLRSFSNGKIPPKALVNVYLITENTKQVFELIIMNSRVWALQSIYKMLVKISLGSLIWNASRHREVDKTIWLQLHLQNRCCSLPDKLNKGWSEQKLYV